MAEKRLYFENLDASRFFAFLLVFTGHCFITTDKEMSSSPVFQTIYAWSKVGVLGLEYFFVLSAFLISIIILEERDQTGKFHVPNFLIRRSLRVWPLYFLILLIGFLVVSTGNHFHLDVEELPPFPYLIFFLVNYYIIRHGSEFLFFIAFLWSISVEEQFYLFWSLVMKFLNRHFGYLCGLLIFISLLYRTYFLHSDAALYFDTLSALGNFGVGGLLALALHQKHSLVNKIAQIPKISVFMIYSLMAALIICYQLLIDVPVFRVFSRMIYSLFFAFLILEQSMGKNRLFNLGRIKLFDYLGKISYGLYCYHGVVITLFVLILRTFRPAQSAPEVFLIYPLLIFILTVLISHLSYRYFEKYFLNLKDKFYSFRP